MSEIKLSLSIELRGSTLFSKEECLKTTHKVIEKRTKAGKIYKKTIEVKVVDWDKMEKHSMKVANTDGTNPEIITFHTRKTKPTTQSINICKEAYDYMTSKECPAWSKIGTWSQMKSEQRLESHLQRIAEHLGGTVISYKVFED